MEGAVARQRRQRSCPEDVRGCERKGERMQQRRNTSIPGGGVSLCKGPVAAGSVLGMLKGRCCREDNEQVREETGETGVSGHSGLRSPCQRGTLSPKKLGDIERD